MSAIRLISADEARGYKALHEVWINSIDKRIRDSASNGGDQVVFPITDIVVNAIKIPEMVAEELVRLGYKWEWCDKKNNFIKISWS